jgi:prevent-host-death family protein
MTKSVVSTSELKAHCSEVVARVARARIPVTITKRGRPVARIVPIDDRSTRLFGFAKGTITVLGDIIEPVDVEWESAR